MHHHCCSLLQFHRASHLLGLQSTLYLSPKAPHPQTRPGEPPLQHHPNPGDQVSTGWGGWACYWSLPALAWFPPTSTQYHPRLWTLWTQFPASQNVQHLLHLLLQPERVNVDVWIPLWMVSGLKSSAWGWWSASCQFQYDSLRRSVLIMWTLSWKFIPDSRCYTFVAT